MALMLGLVPFTAGATFLHTSNLLNPFFQYVIFNNLVAIYFSALVVGVMMPDVDEPSSSLGRRLRIFSDLLKFSIGHRTFTHWLVTRVLLILITILFIENPLWKFFLITLSVGMMIHDIGDLMTGGIRGYLWPLIPANKSFRFSTIKVGSFIEFGFIALFTLFILVQLYFIFKWGY